MFRQEYEDLQGREGTSVQFVELMGGGRFGGVCAGKDSIESRVSSRGPIPVWPEVFIPVGSTQNRLVNSIKEGVGTNARNLFRK